MKSSTQVEPNNKPEGSSIQDELNSEKCSFLEFKINDLQKTIERADTKVSILLTAIGVFLGVAATMMQNQTGSYFWLTLSLAFSAITVLLGVIVLWARNGDKKQSKQSEIKSQKQILDYLKIDDENLNQIRNNKYGWYRLCLISFSLASISTIVFAASCYLK